MKKIGCVILCCFFLILMSIPCRSQTHSGKSSDTIIIQSGFIHEKASPDWLEALKSRMPAEKIDSISRVRQMVTAAELKWKNMIESKTPAWNSFRDSLALPFPSISISDTIYVLTGYGGYDDGFTYGQQTICLDLTALQREYGNAGLSENDSRIDRIFSHEYTHLLHKAWAAKTKLELRTFRDSILWECLYEGIGMYRSLNARWLPVEGKLPAVTQEVLKELNPVFAQRIHTIESGQQLTAEEKISLHKNLSRGPVNKKWGAFPVAVWLAMEAKGNDQRLAYWMDLGPEGVILLYKKYLLKY